MATYKLMAHFASCSRKLVHFRTCNALRFHQTPNRSYSSTPDYSVETAEVSGFLKAQQLFAKAAAKAPSHIETPKKKQRTFAELINDCILVKSGDVSEGIVLGEIVQRLGDDLYIDFGGKFNCVCQAPKMKNTNVSDEYTVGSTVMVQVRDVEMTARFLGYDKDMTLLEADASLIRSLNVDPSNTKSRKPREGKQ